MTGFKVNGPRMCDLRDTPVRPVSLTGSDGSAVLIAHARAHTERKALKPSDPSGTTTRTAVIAAERGTRRASAGVYHLTAAQPVQLGYITCRPGEPLCGTPAPLQPCLDGMSATGTRCHLCTALARREHITVAGSDAA